MPEESNSFVTMTVAQFKSAVKKLDVDGAKEAIAELEAVRADLKQTANHAYTAGDKEAAQKNSRAAYELKERIVAIKNEFNERRVKAENEARLASL